MSKTKQQKWQVEVVRHVTGRVEHVVPGASSMARAERVERGMRANMDHERFYTRIVEVSE